MKITYPAAITANQTNNHPHCQLLPLAQYNATIAPRASTLTTTPVISAQIKPQDAFTVTTQPTQPISKSSPVAVAPAKACTTPARARSVLPVPTTLWDAWAATKITTGATSTTAQSPTATPRTTARQTPRTTARPTQP